MMLAIVTLIFGASLGTGGDTWTHYARTPDRHARLDTAPGPISTPKWVLSQTAGADPITFPAPAGVVVSDDRVFVTGEINAQQHLIAAERSNGSIAWSCAIPPRAFDSWSTPVLDEQNNSVIVATDIDVIAFDQDTGVEIWCSGLPNEVVNASPVVTDDLGPRDRLFITDFDPAMIFGGGSLYCINVDPYDGALNPYDPGEIVWCASLNAGASGNTPAYADSVVYVADNGLLDIFAGSIRAFDATATSTPAPLWTTPNPKLKHGFYGGVAVVGEYGQRHVYAATYPFIGDQTAGNLVKIDAQTGALVWWVDANRTDAIPIPLADGRIALSGGVMPATGQPDFGSRPSIQMFRDLGSSAQLEWDTALDTWDDADMDMIIDPGEFLSVGGWTHQPVLVEEPGCNSLIVGTMPGGAALFGPYTALSVVNLDKYPSDPGFVTQHFSGAGSTPGVADDAVYTIGPAGLFAFDAPAPVYDVDGDGSIDIEDLYAWHQGSGSLDVDQSGAVDQEDANALIARLRKNEWRDMQGR